MKFVLPLILAFAAGPVLAQEAPEAAPPEQQQIFRTGDAAMTCVQISDEAAALSQQFGGAEGGGVMGTVVGVGRAGASMLIPGAGLALAGADALTRPDRERREARATAQEQRWYYLNGLYTGLRCGQEAAAATPAPSAAPPATPVPGS
jgi:predicted phage tail protein